jgi:hypothetical protein
LPDDPHQPTVPQTVCPSETVKSKGIKPPIFFKELQASLIEFCVANLMAECFYQKRIIILVVAAHCVTYHTSGKVR